MNGIFCLYWKWTPTDNTANCFLSYKTEIVPSAPYLPPGGKDKNLYYTKFLDDRIDLNKDITLKVATICSNTTSDFKSFTSPLAPGNPRTMVRNMTCVWHYKEYVNCTWKPGEDTPPGVNYSLRYWLTDDNSCPSAENKPPTPLLDLLDEGEPCQNYTYHSGIPVGCQFKLEKGFNYFNRLVAVVTDRSQNMKAYIYFVCVNNIAKFKPPVINEMKRTPNNSLFVSWDGSNTPIEYEVQLQMSNREHSDNYVVSTGQSLEIPNAQPDVTYAVKVRVKFYQNVLCLPDPREQSQSDWSEERTLQAIRSETTAYIVLLLVPLVIIVATVLLLINMRRLVILICPQIPDPSKVISSDFQQQCLKYGKLVYNEPKKEEVCLVSLLETPPSPSKVE